MRILHEAVREMNRGIRRAGDIVEKSEELQQVLKRSALCYFAQRLRQKAIDSIKAFAPKSTLRFPLISIRSAKSKPIL